MKQFGNIQELLHEMIKRLGSSLELCRCLRISRTTLFYWLSTSDSNLHRIRPSFVHRIAEIALELGIPRGAFPDNAQKLLQSKERRVFLCHSSGDKGKVREIYARLQADQQNPWLDEEDLRPGEDWRTEVEKAIRESVAVVVCLSQTSVGKTGFVQKEIRVAIDAAEERPDGAIFIIPARLENCDLPQRLKHLQRVDLFKPWGYHQLRKTLVEVRKKY